MISQPAILSTFVDKLISYGTGRGLSPAELREVAGLGPDAVSDPERWYPIDCSMALWEHLVRALDDPGVPIAVAASCRIEDYEALGFAIMSSSDVAEALDRAVRYSTFFTNSGNWEIRSGARTTRVTWRRHLPLTLGHRVANENTIAEFVNSLRRVTGSDFRPGRITFRHGRPRSTQAHLEFFRAPITFSTDADSIEFPRGWLSVPLSQPNPALAAFLERYLRGQIKEINSAPGWTARVRQALLEALPTGPFSAATIARRLALGERTLRRHLEAEGTTYRRIVSELRRERATHLLVTTEMSVSEIAFVLGYSDAAAFSRAFRRQAGVSPRDYRKAASAPS